MLICVNFYDVMYSVCLDWAETAEMRLCVSTFFFFLTRFRPFFFYCSFTIAATIAAKFDFFIFQHRFYCL